MKPGAGARPGPAKPSPQAARWAKTRTPGARSYQFQLAKGRHPLNLSACRSLVAAAFGTLVIACTEASPPAAPAVAAVPPPRNAPSNVVPIVQPDRSQSPEATQDRLVALRVHRTPSPEPKPVEPDLIVGLAQVEVENMIGKPDAVRDEPPATVWVYRGEQCTLDVYFYFDIKTNKLTALSYHAAPPGPSEDKVAARSCLGQIRTEKSGKP